MTLLVTGLLLVLGVAYVNALAASHGRCRGHSGGMNTWRSHTGSSTSTIATSRTSSGSSTPPSTIATSRTSPGSSTPVTSHTSSGSSTPPSTTTTSRAPTGTSTPPSNVGGYLQRPRGNASFTVYTGCNEPACGVAVSGFTAAMNQLAFGSEPNLGAGDACGRCFALTGTADPYSPQYTGPFGSIIVKVTDLCPATGNQYFCGQTTSIPHNQFGLSFHFDICEDTGGAAAFFPSGRGALTGTFTEVSCSLWTGTDGSSLWNGACLKSGETASKWPTLGCGNHGVAPS